MTASGNYSGQRSSDTLVRDRAPFGAPSLDKLYEDARVAPAPPGYSIERVAEMSNNPLMAGLSAETRRSALLMALQAAGVDLDLLVADAISRQRALNEHEDYLLRELKDFEFAKAKQGATIKAELERLTAEGLAQIDANQKEVDGRQASFRAWQKRRQQESKRITGVTALLVPRDSAAVGDNLAALLLDCAASSK